MYFVPDFCFLFFIFGKIIERRPWPIFPHMVLARCLVRTESISFDPNPISRPGPKLLKSAGCFGLSHLNVLKCHSISRY